jgi:erythromycin esterase
MSGSLHLECSRELTSREGEVDRFTPCRNTVLLVGLLWLVSAVRGGQQTSAPSKTGVALEPGKAVERPMSGGDAHDYKVSLKTGQFLYLVVDQRGIDLVVRVFSPDGKRIAEVDSPNGDSGPEPVRVVAAGSGEYRLEVRALEKTAKPGGYQVKIEELLTPEQYAERLAAEKARLEEVKQWLAKNAIRLKAAEAGHGFGDMQPLKKVIGQARLVALGEATHGTREFFQLKHRMLEFLVSEMGFTVFGIEATMPEAFDVNEFVLTGKGDPARALAGLYFWTWDTEEVLDMIRWMRNYNADPHHEKKVKFYGFDAQVPTRAARVTLDYVSKVDTKLPAGTKEALSALANPFHAKSYDPLGPDKRQAATDAVRHVLDILDRRKEQFMERTGAGEWAIARQHAQVLAQALALRNPRDMLAGARARDRAMADNIRWILQHEGPGAKMVVWAHNGHVATAATEGLEWMGHHLREMFGPDLVVFGFAFNQGSFQAVQMPFGSGRLRPFQVKGAPEGSLDAMVAASGLSLAAIDLRAIPKNGPVKAWFDEPRATRTIGAGYNEQATEGFWAQSSVPQLYDALLFVERTTSARPNPAGERPRVHRLATPANLDFESGELGMKPQDWAGPTGINGLSYEVMTSTDNPNSGKRCAMIRPKPGSRYGEPFGSLEQTIDARPFRGKRIKLSAAVRTEVEGPANRAHLWLHVRKEGFTPASLLFADDMADRPITTRAWQVFEIVGDVPKDAVSINYGLALIGVGRAWLDSAALEVAVK